MQKYDFSSNAISVVPIKTMLEVDKRDVLKLCPRLKDEVLNTSHFDKMNAKLGFAVISNDVAARIL